METDSWAVILLIYLSRTFIDFFFSFCSLSVFSLFPLSLYSYLFLRSSLSKRAHVSLQTLISLFPSLSLSLSFSLYLSLFLRLTFLVFCALFVFLFRDPRVRSSKIVLQSFIFCCHFCSHFCSLHSIYRCFSSLSLSSFLSVSLFSFIPGFCTFSFLHFDQEIAIENIFR